MKKVLFFLLFTSSLSCYCQISWEGEYSVEYDKELKIPRESKVRIWISDDSLKTMLWSFNAYQKDKWVWENSGYCIVIDSGRVDLFTDNYKDFRPNVQNKVLKKIKKSKLLYVITQKEKMIYIENKQGKKKGKLGLIKIMMFS